MSQPIRHVLTAVDFADASGRSLGVAVDLAARVGAKLTIIHVVEPLPYPYVLPAADSVMAEMRARLDVIVDGVRKRGVDVRGLVTDGTPWREIVEAADGLQADVVVVGTHGRRGAVHALLGSTAEKVVRMSRVPVLTVSAWRFDDHRDAGHRLARAIASADRRAAVLAVGAESALVAYTIARRLGRRFDVLLLREMRSEGRDVGLVAEDGSWLLHHELQGTLQASADTLDAAAQSALAPLHAERRILRRRHPRIALDQRTVLLVCDRATSPTAMVLAANVARKEGARRVVAAIPIADAATTELIGLHVDDVVSLETADRREEIEEHAYRRDRPPTMARVSRLLARRTVRRPVAETAA